MSSYGDLNRTITDEPVVKKAILVCETCGGKNVQMKAWVNANTLEYVETSDYDDDYCEDCKDITCLITEAEYKENQEEEREDEDE
jgi:hypothetical protein